MRYKGYTAKIEFDEEDNVIRGEVIGLRDMVIFEVKSVSEIRKAFHTVVDDYLKYCQTRGEEPEKPYSGNFMVRVTKSLHSKISCLAQKEGKSLNAWVEATLSSAVNAESGKRRQIAAAPQADILKLFPDQGEQPANTSVLNIKTQES
ncbi:MAG TPA: type II toxin-antitoxin system HicB family antitoxin [Gemmataceae bacterium]|jgi:predicted HicB family RNase H-like nuclease|nr:type II toxin-antitoxin system HicB family antitoxin [Gemmataceae bacterium]